MDQRSFLFRAARFLRRFEPLRRACLRLRNRLIIAAGSILSPSLKARIRRVWDPWREATPSSIAPDLSLLDHVATGTWDILSLSIIDWSVRGQRPQQIMSRLADAGHRVFYLSTSRFLPPGERTFEATPLRENVWEIALAPPAPLDVYGGTIDDATAAWFDRLFEELRETFDIVTAVSVVHAATWVRLALSARRSQGWRVVYDCMDEWTSFPGIDPARLDSERLLVAHADLVTISATRHQEKWRGLSDNVLLLPGAAPGAADFETFERAPDPGLLENVPHPIAGYAGAIAALHPLTSIVIVNWNRAGLTRLCIESVLRWSIWPRLEIVLVDNGSTDGSREVLEELQDAHPELHVVFNDGNRGFAAATNQGIRAASGEFLVLLNNDTVPARGWLPRLLRHLADPSIGLAVATTNFSGNESRIDVPYTSLAGMPAFAADHMRTHRGRSFDIEVAAMYCVAMRRETHERVGELDESFEVGLFEDDDYSHRVRLAGYRVVCAEDSFVHHFGQASFASLGAERLQEIWDRNRAVYEKKWGTSWRPPAKHRTP